MTRPTRPPFVLTNDPDHGTFEQTGRVFELLNRHGIKVTFAVFNRVKTSQCELGRHCSPGETADLSNAGYTALLQEQQARGHEIAWHGYSQTGDSRGEFIAGLAQFRGLFNRDPYTYIEHGPNPATHPDAQYKPNLLAVEGANPTSNHYVLDLLQKHCTLVWTQTDLLGTHHPHQPHGPMLQEPRSFFVKRNDGLIHFLRYRLYLIQHQPFQQTLTAHAAPFVGYTHFGYPYRDAWGRWGAERWDDLETMVEQFFSRTAAAGYEFKTLEAFHKEDAAGGCIPASEHTMGPSSPDHIPDPLELLGLEQRATDLACPKNCLRKGALLDWSATLHVLDQLLHGCQSVLFVGDDGGRLSLPLAKARHIQTTLMTPDAALARRNQELLAPTPSCRIIETPTRLLPPEATFDAVVLTTQAQVDADMLQQAHGAARKLIIVAYDEPLAAPFHHWRTPRNKTINWMRPHGANQ